LNNLEIKDKRLRVQKASQGGRQNQQITNYKNVSDEKLLVTPDFCVNPSRVVQFLNMISVHDLYDRDELERVKSDLLSECKKYGDVIGLEVPVIATLDPNLLQEGPEEHKEP
jgi:splicing factor U2AF 65 kDa subunit